MIFFKFCEIRCDDYRLMKLCFVALGNWHSVIFNYASLLFSTSELVHICSMMPKVLQLIALIKKETKSYD